MIPIIHKTSLLKFNERGFEMIPPNKANRTATGVMSSAFTLVPVDPITTNNSRIKYLGDLFWKYRSKSPTIVGTKIVINKLFP